MCLEDEGVKEARVWYEKASHAGCAEAAARLLGHAFEVRKQKEWSMEEYLTRLAICAHTLMLTEVSSIRRVPEGLRQILLQAKRENKERLVLLAGELLYGYVATTEAYAFGKPIFYKEWVVYLEAINFYLQRTKHVALMWIWMAPQLKITLGHDLVKLVAALIFNPKADKRAVYIR